MFKQYLSKIFIFLALAVAILIPHFVSAHEVYVLSSAEIQTAIHTPSVPFLTVLRENLKLFSFWAFLGIIAVISIFLLSIMRIMEKTFDPFFAKTKAWAPIISRVTVGVSFLAAAYYQASYGPELPLRAAYGSFTPIITIILIIIGLLIIADVYVRIAALVALLFYSIAVYHHGWYMLTYTNYLGEIILLLIVGAQTAVTDGKGFLAKTAKKLKPYGFLILRVFFGIALIYTSFYAKILYSNLALFTVEQYHLTKYLHFEPHFLVLGAACVEILIGLFFILGIEIRATALFLLFWLTQSLLFFGEVVWPHIILIGIPIAFFFYGYDKYSVEGYFFKKGNREPVL
jgi:uncharacterized membrane protein YphA (DoxX/SURF4 family)